MFIKVPTQSIVVLGSAQAAIDLLEKRSDSYSSRHRTLMLDLCVQDRISCQPYTDPYRSQFVSARLEHVNDGIYISMARIPTGVSSIFPPTRSSRLPASSVTTVSPLSSKGLRCRS